MAKVVRNPDVLWRRESDETEECTEESVAGILFSGGTMLSVNEFGLVVWELCDGRSIDEMTAALLQSYDVAEDTLRGDLGEFLDGLRQKGFVRYE